MRRLTHISRPRRQRTEAGLWSRGILVLTLAAFVMQSFLVQTHIHITPAAEKILASLHPAKPGDQNAGSPSNPRDKDPANDDRANCPICQEILYAGHYVTPATAAVLPPAVSVSIIALRPEHDAHATAPSHIWQGRAPPTV